MKIQMMNAKQLISALAVAAALSVNAYAADVVTTGDTSTIGQWYGRAGGLAGSDRVSGLATSNTKIGVSYDADVAARTNMPRAQATGHDVGVSYDADVATRTNMPRNSTTNPAKAAGIEGAKSN
jgi:opacity protein-like surface antigen